MFVRIACWRGSVRGCNPYKRMSPSHAHAKMRKSATGEWQMCWRIIRAERPLPRVPDFREDPFVLAEDDVPPVLVAHVLAPVAAEPGAKAGVGHQPLQTFHELVAVRVIQPAIAADAVLDEYGASCVGEDRRARRQGFQGQERQAL